MIRICASFSANLIAIVSKILFVFNTCTTEIVAGLWVRSFFVFELHQSVDGKFNRREH
jgi:hypothetical protein